MSRARYLGCPLTPMVFAVLIAAEACSRCPKCRDSAQQGVSPVTTTTVAATQTGSKSDPSALGSTKEASLPSVAAQGVPRTGKQHFWVSSLLGLPMRASGEPSAKMLALLDYGIQVDVADDDHTWPDWALVDTNGLSGWVRSRCLSETQTERMDGERFSVLTGFVRAALEGKPLAPYTQRTVQVHVSEFNRSDGSGALDLSISAPRLSSPISYSMLMDGTGWNAPEKSKRPHRIARQVHIGPLLRELVDEECKVTLVKNGLSYTSMSGYLTVALTLSDGQAAPLVQRVTVEYSDPG